MVPPRDPWIGLPEKRLEQSRGRAGTGRIPANLASFVASRDSRWRSLYVLLVGLLGALVLRALGATWRVRTTGDDPIAAGRLIVGATWHRGLLVMAHYFRDRDVVVMVSRSRDGDYINAVLGHLGYAQSPRGSSSRGGAAGLRGQIQRVREGRYGGVLCDGPRGPARRLQPGVLVLARQTQLPIQTVAFSGKPCIRFGSWDRVLLPWPFARVRCLYGRAFAPPKPGDDAGFERLRREVEAELNRITHAVDERVGLEPEATAA
jgi:lysophospholipid acyltransferase (LPLAT)-like uncharacterized protein